MSIEQVEQFYHKPLNRFTRNSRPFRLLDIQTCSDPSSRIECTLQHANLLKKPPFKALSYVWGDGTIKVPILLDSKRYDVTRNCYAALLRLRELGETTVWIDAICIDQSNKEEISSQIPLMNYIYPAAKDVIVWLGHVEEERKLNSRETESLAVSLLGELLVEDIHIDLFLDIAKSGNCPELRWQAMKIIYGHPWFQRLWTHQELILSTSATFVLDFHTLHFDQFRLATQAIHRASDKFTFRNPPAYITGVFKDDEGFNGGLNRARSRTLACENRHYPPHKRWSVLNHVNMGRLFDCSEPRDRVYALLGLLDAKIRDRVHVDYEKPVEEVYTEFTKLIIESSRSLEVLVDAGLCRGSSSCPTWVQDWNLRQPESKQPSALSYRSYSACCSIRPLGTMIKENSELAIRGIDVDSVLATVEVPGDDLLADSSHHMTGAKGLYAWKEYFKDYPTGCDPLHAWIRTVSADMNGADINARRLSPELVKAYELVHQFGESPEEDQLLIARAQGNDIDEWKKSFVANLYRFQSAVIPASVNRTFFISRKGYMGMGPETMEKEDMICVILGCNVPLVLRKLRDHYLLVGECFVWGLMDGEAMRDKKLRHVLETFCLR
ncbi:HET-domain-containing protein [Hyaloscypha bicolor E]|uniref:HET-domain-containing protein n=1 Tax=Hyaloscypha bicolor E TaxID=1095630 RepID=A0A2J6SP17_9HELO|nr:HET-domain-containing protein [Hyaloscypha bicolor E]PMD52527.1 HET-domain-containing protein [Hyaloscypha bicolor E]